MTMEYSGNRNYEPSEDISHERILDYEKTHRNRSSNKKFTSSYNTPIGATTNDVFTNQVSTVLQFLDTA